MSAHITCSEHETRSPTCLLAVCLSIPPFFCSRSVLIPVTVAINQPLLVAATRCFDKRALGKTDVLYFISMLYFMKRRKVGEWLRCCRRHSLCPPSVSGSVPVKRDQTELTADAG